VVEGVLTVDEVVGVEVAQRREQLEDVILGFGDCEGFAAFEE
jgi:hypothetical protein